MRATAKRLPVGLPQIRIGGGAGDGLTIASVDSSEPSSNSLRPPPD